MLSLYHFASPSSLSEVFCPVDLPVNGAFHLTAFPTALLLASVQPYAACWCPSACFSYPTSSYLGAL